MLLSRLTVLPVHGADVEISGLTEDSRKVKPGFLFVATPGTKLHGRGFIEDAIQRGAVAVLVPKAAAPFAYVEEYDQGHDGWHQQETEKNEERLNFRGEIIHANASLRRSHAKPKHFRG